MAEHSKIEWTDATWNPVTGCSIVSPGCTNCYAMRLAGTRLQHHASRAGLTQESKAGPVWTGEVRLNEQWLTQPLRWKRPRRIFVCAHGDLFHENVPDEWIDKVFAVMALAQRHQFQVLTKRASRMRQYMSRAADDRLNILSQAFAPGTMPMTAHEIDAWLDPDASPEHRALYRAAQVPWPLPNVWIGVSAEDQRRADERIPDLLATPAAGRFVSAEPLLGPVDLTRYFHSPLDFASDLHWIIVGGESGHGARPMHPAWARDLMRQCLDAGVPFFMKQMSGVRKASMPPIPDDLMIRDMPHA